MYICTWYVTTSCTSFAINKVDNCFPMRLWGTKVFGSFGGGPFTDLRGCQWFLGQRFWLVFHLSQMMELEHMTWQLLVNG